MTYKEHDIVKVKYTIGEMGEMLGISPSKIRFWCLNGWGKVVGTPGRRSNGYRLFTQNQIDVIRKIRDFKEAPELEKFKAWLKVKEEKEFPHCDCPPEQRRWMEFECLNCGKQIF